MRLVLAVAISGAAISFVEVADIHRRVLQQLAALAAIASIEFKAFCWILSVAVAVFALDLGDEYSALF